MNVSASRLRIEDCAIATVAGEEYESGYVAVEDGRISEVGGGRGPDEQAAGSPRELRRLFCQLPTPKGVSLSFQLHNPTVVADDISRLTAAPRTRES
jgi:hypothetical protein